MTLVFVIPTFAYLASPDLFFSAVSWISTYYISGSIAVTISMMLSTPFLALSGFIGFVVSTSTPDSATHWDLTMRGTRYTFAWAARLLIGLAVLLTLRYVIQQTISSGPWWWRS